MEKKINKGTKTLTVLIVPLDWGLGHITRCIPLIKEFKEQGCQMILAGDDTVLALFREEFPGVEMLSVFGYNVRYNKSGRTFFLNLVFQLPKILSAIRREHKWLKIVVEKYKPDIVISDNRLGLYHPNIISIYMTHQLNIKTGYRFFDKIASKIHRHFIKKYDECWVPDFKENGLAGELSHPERLSPNVSYIGAISRFNKLHLNDKIYKLLICISGPEPQRTIFENILLDQLKNFNQKTLLVRGIVNNREKIFHQNENVEIVNHLRAEELNMVFEQAEIILCRSGYTSVMDLIAIGKKAILIPTSGQTEQEYLARYLSSKKNFFSVEQDHFVLSNTLLEVGDFPFVVVARDMTLYKKTIAALLLAVSSGEYRKKLSM